MLIIHILSAGYSNAMDIKNIEYISAKEFSIYQLVSKQEENKLQPCGQVQNLKHEKDNKTADFYQISGLSQNSIKDKLKGGFLEDSADILYKIEQEKGINFRAIYAIGALESGYGKYASGNYNYFGISDGKGGYRDFDSKKQALIYLADLLSGKLYKGKSIDDISKIYCPPNSDKWAKDIKYLMMEI